MVTSYFGKTEAKKKKTIRKSRVTSYSGKQKQKNKQEVKNQIRKSRLPWKTEAENYI